LDSWRKRPYEQLKQEQKKKTKSQENI
jgi:hypothetical protein